MKTLDEVIKAFEICGHDESPKCPYFDTEHWCCCEDHMRSIHPSKNDALEYLKAYRDDRDDLTALRAYWAEQQANPALTWDELKAMEGKPVWVKLLKGKWKGWDVIGGFDEDDFGVAMVTVRGDDYYKADLGKTWQAYRKERK